MAHASTTRPARRIPTARRASPARPQAMRSRSSRSRTSRPRRSRPKSDALRLVADCAAHSATRRGSGRVSLFYNEVNGEDNADPDVRESLLQAAIARTGGTYFNPFGYTFRVANNAVVVDQPYTNPQALVDSFSEMYRRSARGLSRERRCARERQAVRAAGRRRAGRGRRRVSPGGPAGRASAVPRREPGKLGPRPPPTMTSCCTRRDPTCSAIAR